MLLQCKHDKGAHLHNTHAMLGWSACLKREARGLEASPWKTGDAFTRNITQMPLQGRLLPRCLLVVPPAAARSPP